MYKSKSFKKIVIFLMIQFMLALSFDAYVFGKASEEIQPNTQGKEKDACSVIHEKVRQGINIKKYVKTSIQMGYTPCSIIKCSIEAGGDTEQTVTGAIEAGVTTDVVTRCALTAGVDGKSIASILTRVSLPGACYILPENLETFDYYSPPRPPAISPSRF